MPALDFGKRVTQCGEEILVRGDDRTVEIELDHGLRAADRSDLAGVLHAANLLGRDVARELDHLHRLAAGIDDRIVRSLDPDLAISLADALELAGLVLAEIEIRPERAVFRALAHVAGHEYRMVL